MQNVFRFSLASSSSSTLQECTGTMRQSTSSSIQQSTSSSSTAGTPVACTPSLSQGGKQVFQYKESDSQLGSTCPSQRGTRLSWQLITLFFVNVLFCGVNIICLMVTLLQSRRVLDASTAQLVNLKSSSGNASSQFYSQEISIFDHIEATWSQFAVDAMRLNIGVFLASFLTSASINFVFTVRIVRFVQKLKEDMLAVAKLEFAGVRGELGSPVDSPHTATTHAGCTPRINFGGSFTPRVNFGGCNTTKGPSIREIAEIRESFTCMANGLRSFQKYMDPRIVHALVQSRRQSQLGVQPADATIFFSDVANFTGMAETLEPSQLMDILSIYFDEMSSIIMSRNGIVGEFIGDAIMAWWNVPLELGDQHTVMAMDAALQQQRRLSELRRRWCAARLPEVRARMGLVRGQVLAGNIGSSQRMKYGLVGDRVNLCSRLEGLCKTYGVDILIDGEAAAAPGVSTEFNLRPIDVVAVKGRSEASELYELVGRRSEAIEEEDKEVATPNMTSEECYDFCEAFSIIHGHYRRMEFQAALDLLILFEQRWPSDKPAKIMRERCADLLAHPPDEEWDCIVRLDHK